MRKYKAKKITVVAIQIPEDSKGLEYEKWGSIQFAKPGDWLVNKLGETYSIDAESFANTMKPLDRVGHYYKFSEIWGEVAVDSGVVETKEGTSQYVEGDYLVSNNEDFTDKYCISKEKFEKLYEVD